MICTGSIEATSSESNKRFQNWSQDIRFSASRSFRPTTRVEIVEIIRQAEERGDQVKAVGTLWSFTESTVSTGVIIETDLLANEITTLLPLLPLTSTAATDLAAGDLVHIQSGIKVRDLNRLLHRSMGADCMIGGNDKALPTMGGSGGQSISGVISTGSHGGDVNLPVIADAIVAIHLIGPGGQEWWIERENGITTGTESELEAFFASAIASDPSLSLHMCEHVKVRKDDDFFRSAMVSVGRMGVVYSYVLRVQDCFKLTESRSGSDWATFRPSIAPGMIDTFIATGGLHYLGVIINPFRNGAGTFDCIITTRTIASSATAISPPSSQPDIFGYFCRQQDVTQAAGILVGARVANEALFAGVLAIPPPPELITAILFEIAKQTTLGGLRAISIILDHLIVYLARPGVTIGDLIGEISNTGYAIGLKDQMRELLRAVFGALYPSTAASKTDLSWKIMDTYDYQAQCYKVDSMEFAFDAMNTDTTTHFFGFIDEVLVIIEDMFGRNVPVAGILALRFTSATEAYIGMSQFQRTCHIEIPVLKGLSGNGEFLQRVQNTAKRFNGIPHWGQIMNHFDASDVRRVLPNLVTWRYKLGELIREGGGNESTFSNEFTRRYELEPLFPIVVPEGIVRLCVMVLSALGEREAMMIRTIRTFKYEVLNKNELGKEIIGFYSWISPPLARFIYDNKSFRRLAFYAIVWPSYAISSVFLPEKKSVK